MHAVTNLSHRTQLAGVVAGLVAVSFALASVLLGAAGSLNAGGGQIAGSSVPAIEMVDQLRIDELAFRADQLWNITNTDIEHPAAPSDAIRADAAQIGTTFQLSRQLLSRPRDARLLAAARDQWAAYLRATRALDAVPSNATLESMFGLANASLIRFSRLAPSITALLRLGDQLARDRAGRDASTFASARAIAVVLLVLAVLLAAAFAITLRRSLADVREEPVAVEPVAEAPQPAIEAPEPVVEVSAPPVEIPEPVAEASEPVVEASEPPAEVPEPVAEAPEPVAEAPEPEPATPEEEPDLVVRAVTAIAQFSNRLALGAAIEATRPGGRDSAAAAAEVNRLAAETQLAANAIGTLIEAVHKQSASAARFDDDGAQIAAASQQISASARSMGASLDEIGAFAAELAVNAETLHTLVTRVRA